MTYLDIRYGGVIARCESASYLIERYLMGDENAVAELREARLEKPLFGFPRWKDLSAVNAWCP